jgi:hypothetical protein
VSSPQDHAGRAAHLQRFAPAGRTQAPAVAGPQAGKAELGHRHREIIAAGFGKLEKRGGHDDADRVAADVFSTGVAAAVTKEPCLGLHRADVEPVAEDIPGRARATSTVPAVIPQHCRPLDRRHARRIPASAVGTTITLPKLPVKRAAACTAEVRGSNPLRSIRKSVETTVVAPGPECLHPPPPNQGIIALICKDAVAIRTPNRTRRATRVGLR